MLSTVEEVDHLQKMMRVWISIVVDEANHLYFFKALIQERLSSFDNLKTNLCVRLYVQRLNIRNDCLNCTE
jgi:ribonucleotide reductase beta subunit family protein with ferritin-like domain